MQKNIFISQCYNVKYRLHLQNGNKRKQKNHHKKRLSEVQENHKTKTNYVMLWRKKHYKKVIING